VAVKILQKKSTGRQWEIGLVQAGQWAVTKKQWTRILNGLEKTISFF
jgi:hypothetical protein